MPAYRRHQPKRMMVWDAVGRTRLEAFRSGNYAWLKWQSSGNFEKNMIPGLALRIACRVFRNHGYVTTVAPTTLCKRAKA